MFADHTYMQARKAKSSQVKFIGSINTDIGLLPTINHTTQITILKTKICTNKKSIENYANSNLQHGLCDITAV